MEPLTMLGLAAASLLGWVSYMCLRHEIAMDQEQARISRDIVPAERESVEASEYRALVKMLTL